ASLIRDDTVILSLQNGLGVDRHIRAALQDGGVFLRGITQFGAIFDRPGRVRFMVRGFTLIERHERSARIADTLNAAGLDCRISPDIAADVWRKLIYNCVVNPITAMVGSRVGGITDPRLAPVKRIVIDECVAVAAAEGITFQDDFMHEIDTVFAGSPNIVSMLQDLRRGRATEIDYMNGAVAALAETHGIAAPANSGLTSIIKAMERAGGSLFPKEVLEPEAV
ncbi:MAG TPA: 2-dehydropantoate 2-reductase, partial [Chthoniobacterales bacterium]